MGGATCIGVVSFFFLFCIFFFFYYYILFFFFIFLFPYSPIQIGSASRRGRRLIQGVARSLKKKINVNNLVLVRHLTIKTTYFH